MLLGAAVMIALVRDGGDDAGLIVVPADAADAGRLADRRTRAVGGDQESRDEPLAGSKLTSMRSALASKPRHRVGAKLDALRLGPLDQRIDQRRFSIICANGSPGATSPPNVRNVGRIASRSLESVTTMSRIGCAPSATVSQTPMVSNKRRAAAAIAEARASPRAAVAERRIGDRDLEAIAEPLAQRDGQREAGKAAAADQHIGARQRRSDRFVFAMAEVYHCGRQ